MIAMRPNIWSMAKDTRTGSRHLLPKRGVYVELKLWDDVKKQAGDDGHTLNEAIVELLRGYVSGKYTIERKRPE